MAEARNQWEVTRSYSNGKPIEQFCKGKHIKTNDWDCPTFQSTESVECLFTPDSMFHSLISKFRVRSLIHATTPQATFEISDSQTGGELRFGFKGNPKKLGSYVNLQPYLLWWGIKPEDNDIDDYKTKVDECGAWVNGDVCSTSPFNQQSRYGNIMFEYGMKDLLDAYSSQFCEGQPPAFRVLGTFAYTKEVMHVVLICRPDDLKAFTDALGDLPVPNEENSVIYKDGEEWVWIPKTTIEIWKEYPTYRRWEHATFAFHLPVGRSLNLGDKDGNMHFCEAANEKVFRMHAKPDDRTRYTYKEASTLFKEKGLKLLQFKGEGNSDEYDFMNIVNEFL